LNQTISKKPIKIRINIDEDDPLFPLFNEIKEKTGINANTEVIRYSLKQAYDFEFKNKKPKKNPTKSSA